MMEIMVHYVFMFKSQILGSYLKGNMTRDLRQSEPLSEGLSLAGSHLDHSNPGRLACVKVRQSH